MDELLDQRVKQLKDIADRLEKIEKASHNGGHIYEVWKLVRALRFDVQDMARAAELEYDHF